MSTVQGTLAAAAAPAALPFGWSAATATVVVACCAVVAYRCVVSPTVAELSRRATPVSRHGTPGPTGTASALDGGYPPPSRRARVLMPAAAVLLAAASFPVLPGVAAPGPGGLRWLIALILVALTWRFGTTDFDLRRPERGQWRDRGLLPVFAAAALVWPVALLGWIAVSCGRLRGWTHHAMMSTRLLKAYLSWAATAPLLAAGWPALRAVERPALFFLLATVCLSHYLKPAWSKASLGARWWTWAWENRTDFIAANCYGFGWGHFVPERVVLALLRALRPWVRPLNFLTMLVEASPLVALTDRRALVLVCAATVVFHVLVFLLAGILFWENATVNIGLALAVLALPPADTGAAFGLEAAAAAAVLMALTVPDLLWQPTHLGWWDNPFTTRVRWQVETVSGRSYYLGNDYMCPFEREFGRWTGLCFIPEPVIGGAGWGSALLDEVVRDEVRAALGRLPELDDLKRERGTLWWNEQQSEAHVEFLQTVFGRLNAGRRKGPLRGGWRRIKAPGGQLFHTDARPAYRGGEPVRRIVITCEERCYLPAEGRIELMRHRVLREVEIPVPEPVSVP